MNWPPTLLASEYYDLNGTHIDVLEQPPTALEFARLVHISRPVLIRGVEIPTMRFWDDDYLAASMGETEISVAVTPNGRADAVTQGADGKLYFVEPHVQKMKMADFLRSESVPDSDDSEIYYLQSQNGNVFSNRSFEGTPDPSEFEALRTDIPREIPWCSEALGRSPDAVNLWIGNHESITSIHSDPYENIYTVVRGSKHFTLLPPTEGWCLQERIYPHAKWTRKSPDAALTMIPSPDVSIRWASVIDPHTPGKLPSDAHPLRVTVEAGETLYLPSGWWHHVSQEDKTIALNWWYDMEMRGMSWILLNFLRGVGEVPLGNSSESSEKEDE
ncbi:cupin-like domain-containing protein [Mycena belliarum]|uniref:Cupin-like domain-containing protein n=1 Tax=Mycena belliarum TaxID=1033014 RepID=A0AAD6XTY1_9AGAR|nr:cupin-like domain-containing protein [Mycena belliae]